MRGTSAIGRLPRGGVGNYPASLALVGFASAPFRLLAAIFLFALFATGSLAQTTLPGTQIRNVAQLGFAAAGAPRLVASNEAVVTVQAAPTLAAVEILRFAASAPNNTAGPTACAVGSAFQPLPAPTVAGVAAIDPLAGVPLTGAPVVHAGDAVFIRLIDGDKNLNGAQLDTVTVRVQARATGDGEVIRLTETGPNTGVFTGYVPTRLAGGGAAAADCALQLERDSAIDVLYTDPNDARDVAQASSLVDPSGVVFNSSTGARINGARVRLVDALSGLPAVVFGDDAVSRFPAEMITGAAVTDSGGTNYVFPAGVFRFPLVAPGSYRLVVEPPAGFVAPSDVAPASLVGLPGGPFRIQPGSFGNPFAVTAPAGAALDVPVDPAGDSMTLSKTTVVATAAVGDVIEYQLRLQNTSARGPIRNITLLDQLPPGLRLRPGSVRIDDAAARDPALTADGHGMTFTVPLLRAGQALTLRYVVDVVPAPGLRELVNTATASGSNDVRSNVASSRVAVRPDFYTERGFILGRVLLGGCDARDPKVGGQGGIRIYLPDGRYAVTDAGGRYHFENLRPGTLVLQLDTTTIPESRQLLNCADNSRAAGRDYSRFIELRAGELQQVDFALLERPPPKGELRIALTTTPLAGARFVHKLRIEAAGVAASKLGALLMLPVGLQPADPKEKTTDGAWSISLGSLRAGKVREIELSTIAVDADTAGMQIQAVALFDSPAATGQRTKPVVNRFAVPEQGRRRAAAILRTETFSVSPRFASLGTDLAVEDSAALARVARKYRNARVAKAVVAGHADRSPISGRALARFADNLALSRARAEAVARWLQEALELGQDQIAIEAYGDTRPLTEGRDAASLARNRRVQVELFFETTVQAEPSVVLATEPAPAAQMADRTMVPTLGAWDAGPVAEAPKAGAAQAQPEIVVDIAQLKPEFAWLAPAADSTPSIASTKVALVHPYGTRIRLLLDGEEVSALNFDGVETNDANNLHVSRWRGVDLRDGDNRLVAELIDPSGEVARTLARSIHYGDGAVRAQLDKQRSVLLADGRQRPVIAVKLFDAFGEPARPGTRGLFKIDAPYRSWWEVEQLDDNPLLTPGIREPQFEVEADGLSRIELEPTTQAGFAVLHLRFNERRSQELRVWLEPAAREFVFVGVASGTAAHQTLSANAEQSPLVQTALAAEGVEEGIGRDGRVAFFAKGRIRGDFLLTLAYDSERDREAARERLKGVVAPDEYYLLYGDATTQREEAASGEPLYIKLERRQFVALFGDYDTGFTVTEFARYSRSLTGLKADFGGERVSVSAFAARTDLGTVRDQIPGDGTSGLYRLSRRPIVIGSDKLRIEVRERFSPERVVSSRELSRFLDYRIDYTTGTVSFREPVNARDTDFNPITIVAEYETPGSGEESTSAGARVSWRGEGERVEIGATAVQDGAEAGDSRLLALDARYKMSDITEWRAEIGRSESDDATRAESASAWLTELKHIDERLEYRAYARSEDSGFGVGQNFEGLGGSRKFGAEARWQWRRDWSIESEAFVQQSLETDASRQLAQAELRYQSNGRAVGFGVEHAHDEDPGGVERESQNVRASASIDLLERKLTLRGTLAAPLGGSADSVDHPARSLLGIDYQLPRATTLFAEWEHGSGGSLDTDMTRIGLRAQPFDRTQLTSSVTQESSEFGPRVASNLGLSQGWQLNERWSFDGGLEQSNTLRGPGFAPQNPQLPLAAGTLQDDFLAIYLGTQYHRDDWTMASRVERRTADSEDRWLATAGWYRAERNGHALSLIAQTERRDALTGEDSDSTDIRFAWAFRPEHHRWIVLNRLDLRGDARSGALSDYESLRLVNNLHANWQWNAATQLGLQLGLKQQRSTFGRDRFSGSSGLVAVDWRRDLTRRLDLGLHLGTERQFAAHTGADMLGFDVGFSPVTNVWLSLGFNFRGFDDRDFAAGRYHHQGPYLQFRLKLDQDSFKDLNLGMLRPSTE